MDVTTVDLVPNVKVRIPGSASAIVYDPPVSNPGKKYGCMPLTTLLINAKEEPLPHVHKYVLGRLPVDQSSAIYLIRYKGPGQHAGYFKVGRGKKCLRRLASYKTYVPQDHAILVVAVLSLSDLRNGIPSTGRAPALICGLEDILLRNMDAWAVSMPTKVKRLRRTEWFRRNPTAEALVVSALWQFTQRIADLHPTLKATLHIYSKTPFNDSLDLSDSTSSVNYKLKGVKKKLSKLEAAEAKFTEDQDGFTKTEARKQLPAKWRK